MDGHALPATEIAASLVARSDTPTTGLNGVDLLRDKFPAPKGGLGGEGSCKGLRINGMKPLWCSGDLL